MFSALGYKSAHQVLESVWLIIIIVDLMRIHATFLELSTFYLFIWKERLDLHIKNLLMHPYTMIY